MSAVSVGVAPRVGRRVRGVAAPMPAWRSRLRDLARLAPAGMFFGASCLALVLGIGCLTTTALEHIALPAVGLLAVALVLQTSSVYGERRSIDPVLVGLLGLCLIGAAVIGGLPTFFGAFGLKAIIHHSTVSTVVLLGLGVPCACASLYFLLGATPAAEDISRYPLILVPVVLVLGIYAVVGANLIGTGVQQLAQVDRTAGSTGWTVFLRPFVNPNVPPYVMRSGLVNQLLGTGLLVGLTMLIALPVGVGTGVFVSEVASGRLARVVRMATTALRGMSVFVLALLATSMVAFARDTPLGPIIAGYFIDTNGFAHLARGSYVTAALVTALLVMPVVARATEEGCRSLPRGIREGSAALGATEDHTLLHLTLPWAVPNILTGLLLGSAEASGSMATLFFIAGAGENGVSPLGEVTSLAFAVFYAQYSPDKPFRDLHQPYQYAAALALLAIALSLTVLALVIKRRQAARYGGT